VALANSVVQGFPSSGVVCGNSGGFVIQAKDQFDNQRQSPNDVAQFVVELVISARITSTTCSGAASFSADVDNLLCTYDTGGRYNIIFTPKVVGTFTVNPKYQGSNIGPPGALTFPATAASADAGATTVDLASVVSVIAGASSSFTMTCRDRFNNIRILDDDTSKFDVTIARQGTFAPVTIGVRNRAAGVYTQFFTTTITGTYIITARLLGNAIQNSGATFVTNPGPINATNTLISGTGAGGGDAATLVWFTIQGRDTFFNLRNDTNSVFAVQIQPQPGASTTTPNPTPVSLGGGLYNVTYSVPSPYQAFPKNTFNIHITLVAGGTLV